MTAPNPPRQADGKHVRKQRNNVKVKIPNKSEKPELAKPKMGGK